MKTIPLCLTAVAVATLMSACVVAPRPVYHPQPVYAPQPYPAGTVIIQNEPPAPYAEVIGIPPTPGYVWIGGAWFWEGGRHVWHGGYWSAPRSGHYWVAHHWERAGNGWYFREGHWEPHRR